MADAAVGVEYFAFRSTMDPSTGCVNWDWCVDAAGYGRFGQKGYAHRGMWIAVNGPIPDGMFVCHRCDNRRCVNPDHLFLGTHAENMRDMVRKGRSNKAKGSAAGPSKLTEHDVSIIKWCLDAGVTQDKLAKLYGVSQSAVSGINVGRTWKHVKAMSMETR